MEEVRGFIRVIRVIFGPKGFAASAMEGDSPRRLEDSKVCEGIEEVETLMTQMTQTADRRLKMENGNGGGAGAAGC
jgi:hypothetical protein